MSSSKAVLVAQLLLLACVSSQCSNRIGLLARYFNNNNPSRPQYWYMPRVSVADTTIGEDSTASSDAFPSYDSLNYLRMTGVILFDSQAMTSPNPLRLNIPIDKNFKSRLTLCNYVDPYSRTGTRNLVITTTDRMIGWCVFDIQVYAISSFQIAPLPYVLQSPQWILTNDSISSNTSYTVVPMGAFRVNMTADQCREAVPPEPAVQQLFLKLKKLYMSSNGPSWVNQYGWRQAFLSDTPNALTWVRGFCTWRGINCPRDNAFVDWYTAVATNPALFQPFQLQLSSNNVSGAPVIDANLTTTVVVLDDNTITDLTGITSTYIIELSVVFNHLTGLIPFQFLGRFDANVDLSRNQYRSSLQPPSPNDFIIPPDFSLGRMRSLNVSSNFLVGRRPPRLPYNFTRVNLKSSLLLANVYDNAVWCANETSPSDSDCMVERVYTLWPLTIGSMGPNAFIVAAGTGFNLIQLNKYSLAVLPSDNHNSMCNPSLVPISSAIVDGKIIQLTFDLSATLSTIVSQRCGSSLIMTVVVTDVGIDSNHRATTRFAVQAVAGCHAGTFSVNGRDCQLCGVGTVSSAGSTSCSQCPAGQINAVPGANRCSKCPPGTFSAPGAGECTACPVDSYATVASEQCSSCARSDLSTNGKIGCFASSQCQCRSPKYLNAVNGTCVTCPIGGVCQAGAFNAGTEYGFWHTREKPNDIISCIPSLACIAAAADQTTVCAVGFDGERCAACGMHFFRDNGQCTACKSDMGVYLLIPIFIVLCFILETQAKPAAYDVPYTAFGLSIGYMQLISLFAHLTVPWSDGLLSLFRFASTTNVNLELFQPECGLQVSFWMKLILKLTFPLMVVIGVVLIRTTHCNRIGSLIMNRYARKTTRQPTVTSAVIAGASSTNVIPPSGIVKFRPDVDQKSPTPILDSILYTSVLIFNWAYTLLLSASTSAFNCVPNGAFDVVLSDSTVQCYTEDWYHNIGVAISGIVVCGLLIPLAVIIAVQYHARKGRLNDLAFKRRFGFLTAPYRPEFYWWEIVNLIRRLAIIMILDLFSRHVVSQFIQMLLVAAVVIIFMILQANYQPYVRSNENIISLLWLSVTLFVLFTAIVLNSAKNEIYVNGLVETLPSNLSIGEIKLLTTINFIMFSSAAVLSLVCLVEELKARTECAVGKPITTSEFGLIVMHDVRYRTNSVIAATSSLSKKVATRLADSRLMNKNHHRANTMTTSREGAAAGARANDTQDTTTARPLS